MFFLPQNHAVNHKSQTSKAGNMELGKQAANEIYFGDFIRAGFMVGDWGVSTLKL